MAAHQGWAGPKGRSAGQAAVGRSPFSGPARAGERLRSRGEEKLAKAAAADATLFAAQPPGTAAVRHDGVRLVVPGAIGDLSALDGRENPVFLDRSGTPLGHLEIQGVADTPLTCSLFAISNLSKVRGGAYLAVWYLTTHTLAPSFEVQSVNPATLGRLLKRLGMKGVPGTNNMAGATEEVRDAVRRKCQSHHWRLRTAGAGAS